MLSSEFIRILTPPTRVLHIIWAAFLTAPLVYVFIAWLMFGRKAQEPAIVTPGQIDPALIQWTLTGVAAVQVVVSFVWRRRAFSDETLRAKMKGVDTGAGTALSAPQLVALQEGVDTLPTAEQRLANLFPHYQQTTIVVLAMREAIAIFGLVLAIISASFTMVLPWAGTAIVLMAAQPPAAQSFMESKLHLARSF